MMFLFLLCVVALWLFYGYTSATNAYNETLKCFGFIDRELNNRYKLINEIIAGSHNCIEKEKPIIEDISNLQNNAVTLGLNPEFINRRMAFDKELEIKSEQLISAIKENEQIVSNEQIKNNIMAYEHACNKIIKLKQDFNISAKKLRKAVDVFPSSLMARLNKIKSFDYIK